jgi:hypothetical protein
MEETTKKTLSEKEQQWLKMAEYFVKKFYTPCSKFNTEFSSYSLKHQVEDYFRVCGNCGIKFDFENTYYISNEMLILAMENAGFRLKKTEKDSPNYYFNFKYVGPKVFDMFHYIMPFTADDWEKIFPLPAKQKIVEPIPEISKVPCKTLFNW